MAYQAIPTSGDQETIAVVGHVHAFPRHPAGGTEVVPFPGGPIALDQCSPEQLYALVCVEWAQQWVSIDMDSGTETVEYRRDGSLGTPTGTTWYLRPVTVDNGIYRLVGNVARGFRDAHLPALPGVGVPESVPIHDHRL